MTTLSLSDKSIVLGVSGGIAAYKSATVASKLVQAGAKLDVLMTEAAVRFIQPLTFNAITHRPVHTDVFAPISEHSPGHVEIALRADLVIVAPATAHTIAALALGLSDDLISLVALSSSAPILIAPAMEAHMYNHPATQANVSTLVSRGVTLVGPRLRPSGVRTVWKRADGRTRRHHRRSTTPSRSPQHADGAKNCRHRRRDA